MKRFLHLLASTAVLLLAGASVRADTLPTPWTYSWQRDPVSIAANGAETGGVSLTSEAQPKSAAGNSDIVATNLRVFSSATPSAPDTFSNNGAYVLSLTLTDSTSANSGTLTFAGKLSGTFSTSNANITNLFSSPTEQKITLGNNVYDVTIGPYSPPGPPSATNAGSIAAHVDVSPVGGGGGGGGGGPPPVGGGGGGGGGGGISDVPEPSSILLSCLGLTFVGGAAGRKRLLALFRK
jgi:hypothetical protein